MTAPDTATPARQPRVGDADSIISYFEAALPNTIPTAENTRILLDHIATLKAENARLNGLVETLTADNLSLSTSESTVVARQLIEARKLVETLTADNLSLSTSESTVVARQLIEARKLVETLTAERDELHQYAFALTRAFTNLDGGGSELFGGRLCRDTPREMYAADIDFCIRRARERRTNAWERATGADRRADAAEAALANLQTRHDALLAERAGVSEAMVEAGAIQNFAIDDAITVEDAARLIRYGIGQEHSGDCTKENHTCMVCFREGELDRARKVLEAALAAQPAPDRRQDDRAATAPEPLKRLGQFLGDVLNEADYRVAENMLLAGIAFCDTPTARAAIRAEVWEEAARMVRPLDLFIAGKEINRQDYVTVDAVVGLLNELAAAIRAAAKTEA